MDGIVGGGSGAGPNWGGAGATKGAKEYSRWDHLFPKCLHSPLEFYATLEEVLEAKKIPEIKMSRVTWKERGIFSSRREYLRVRRTRYIYDICAAPFGEDFFFSAWLLVKRPEFSRFHVWGILTTVLSIGAVAYDGTLPVIIGSVAAAATLIIIVRSGVLAELVARRVPLEEFLMGMTIVIAFYDCFYRPLTYFEEDTAAMFQKSVLGSMQDVIDGLSETKGIRRLTADERKPLIKGFQKMR